MREISLPRRVAGWCDYEMKAAESARRANKAKFL